MARVFAFLDHQPLLLLFAVVAAGYAIGRIKIRGFTLGPTAASIIIGLLLSLWAAHTGVHFKLPDFASSLFFTLFIYAVGMRIGPQATSSAGKDGGRYMVLALIISVLAPLLVLLCRFVFKLPPGAASGLLAGANTASPALGGAQAALETGAVRGAAQLGDTLKANLSGAFALTYVINYAGFILFTSWLPKITRSDVVGAGRAYDDAMKAAGPPLPDTAGSLSISTGSLPVDIRVFSLEGPALVGESVAELRTHRPRLVIEGVRRHGDLVNVDDDLVLERGDRVAIGGPLDLLLDLRKEVGPELEDTTLRDIHVETADIVVRKDTLINRPLSVLRQNVGHGIYFSELFRAGSAISFGDSTELRRGDILRVVGATQHVRALEKAAGSAVRSSTVTDILSLALGIAAGALAGAITVPVFGMHLGLGTTGGVLIAAIVISTLRTRLPWLGGPFPESARQLLEDLGLNVFISILGLSAGASITTAMNGSTIVPLLVSSVIVGFIPATIAWFAGLKMRQNAAVLLGGVAGARQCTGALESAQEVARSHAPAVGFPLPFAVATILFTIFGYVFMTLKL